MPLLSKIHLSSGRQQQDIWNRPDTLKCSQGINSLEYQYEIKNNRQPWYTVMSTSTDCVVPENLPLW